ncbi:hypothetical protein [Megalodesulfovibrio paquesii]
MILKLKHGEGFLLVAPQDIHGEDVRNAHVFKGTYNPFTRSWTIKPNRSHCGKMRCHTLSPEPEIAESDERKFCHMVVDAQFKYGIVCGSCMATFFADDD